MGRYYQGDIEGKFMVAIQSSNAAERFGAKEIPPYYVEYVIHRSRYKEIVKELESIKSSNPIEKLVSMFKKTKDRWSEEKLEKHGVTKEDLSAYADHGLGEQIKDWFDKNPNEDFLRFSAEL